eukprot:1381926-Amorphochlora_amoeboformis.AAC.1
MVIATGYYYDLACGDGECLGVGFELKGLFGFLRPAIISTVRVRTKVRVRARGAITVNMMQGTRMEKGLGYFHIGLD